MEEREFNDVRKLFCKEYNIPNTLYEEPYFGSRMALYEPYYQTKTNWDEFYTMIENFDSINSFLTYRQKLGEMIYTSIVLSSQYINFLNSPLKKNTSNHAYSYRPPKHDDPKYLRISIKDVEFYALRDYSNSIVSHCDSMEDLILKSTKYQALSHSERIKDIVKSNLFSSKIEYLCTDLVNRIFTILSQYHLHSLLTTSFHRSKLEDTSWEFYMGNTSLTEKQIFELMACIRKDVMTKLDIKVDIEYYRVHDEKNRPIHYEEHFLSNGSVTYKIKKTSERYLPFLIRQLEQTKLEELDYVFIRDGVLCKYIENPITTQREERIVF